MEKEKVFKRFSIYDMCYYIKTVMHIKSAKATQKLLLILHVIIRESKRHSGSGIWELIYKFSTTFSN